ncbi:dUTP diphosphatase [Entomobacter blattae]|uniref:dUTP diphosphatase n=1 Tax=Entomobacter blattae TaxID=2762277 RepID=A0A7H1NU10_9PROT|nr:dUTP diphosphatase [Entomobacter blattae]QNT79270.1 Deoxyuridine 5'-triphosphate nucleotidohydrolase [Entomobacter blattae]
MNNKMKLKIQTLPHYDLDNWGLPSYGSEGAAGFDLRAALHTGQKEALRELFEKSNANGYSIIKTKTKGDKNATKLNIPSGFVGIIPTGICIEIPQGCELQIRSRSGMGMFGSLVIAHGTGTIDSDYRGEILIGLRNMNLTTRVIRRGACIAQAILAPVYRAEWEQTTTLTETQRGQNGFGSTGL